MLNKYFQEVEIDDKTNLEAQAARVYWKCLMGDDFRRDPTQSGVNSFLNYGYAVLRSALARSVSACGLNPTLGVHHNNFENPFCLVDDLMEPFRPIVDNYCYAIRTQTELDTAVKRKLSIVLEHGVIYKNEGKALSAAIHEYCQSFTSAIVSSEYELFESKINLNLYAV